MIGRAVVSCAEVERAAATSPKVFHLVCHHAFARAFPALLRQGEDVSEDANSFMFYRHDVGNHVSIKFSDVEPRFQRVQRFGDAPFDVPFVVPRLMSKELLDFPRRAGYLARQSHRLPSVPRFLAPLLPIY